MRTLITGGSGFIGKSLIQSGILPGELYYPRHEELDLLNFSLVEEYIKKNKIEFVIHAAVFSALATERELGFERDLRMFINIIRCTSLVKKIIYFGSGAEFGKTRNLIKIKEDQWGKYVPKDHYGFAKYLMHEIGKNNPKVLNLRLFGIFGNNEDYRFKFITNTIAKHVLRLPITIKQDVIFDYLDVNDLAQVVKYFLINEFRMSDYNVTPTESIKLSEIVTLVDKVGKAKSHVKILTPNLNNQYTGNNERLTLEIPNLFFIPLEESINTLYKHLKDRASSLDSKALNEDNFLVKAIIKT